MHSKYICYNGLQINLDLCRMLKYLDMTLAKKVWVARITMMIVYVWFGFPKIFGLSSAEGIVTDLSEKMLIFIPSDIFLIILGVFEVALGLAFLVPKLTKYIVPIFWGHMLSTFMPLILLPGHTWSSFMVLTLEGQYIVKNIVLIALSLFIYDNGRKQIVDKYEDKM